MSARTSCWLWLILIFVIFIPSSSADQKNITAETGQNVTLTCQAPNNNSDPKVVVEWSRTDLGTEYVLLYRDVHFDESKQHPSFKNRVDLQDRQMKDGDASLTLKNVSINDTGTYECRIKTGTKRRKRANLSGDPISIINLSVVDPPPGQPGGSSGLRVGLSVFGLLVGVVAAGSIGSLIYRKLKQSQGQYQPPAQQQLTETSQTNSPLDSESVSNEREKEKSLYFNSLVNSLDRRLQLGEKLQAFKEKIQTL